MCFKLRKTSINLSISFPISILVAQFKKAIIAHNKSLRLAGRDSEIIELHREKRLQHNKCVECGEEEGVITNINIKKQKLLGLEIRCMKCANLLGQIWKKYPEPYGDGHF